MRSRLIESIIIGILAGGWASCTYWEGAAGVCMGGIAFALSMFFLTIEREEERKHTKKSARPAGTGRTLKGYWKSK